MIPLQKPLITPNQLHETYIQSENAFESPPENSFAADAVPSALQSSSHPNDISAKTLKSTNQTKNLTKKDANCNKRVEKKRLKQQQKQLAKINKKVQKSKKNEKNNNKKLNNNVTSSIVKRSVSPSQHRVPTATDGKNKSLPCVKFAFDNEPELQQIDETGVGDEANAIVIEKDNLNESNNKRNRSTSLTTEHNNNGEYDALPLIRIEQSSDSVDGHSVQHGNDDTMDTIIIDQNGNAIKQTTISEHDLSDSIPFIDDDDSPNPKRRANSVPIEHKNLHESRFITLQPQNIGTQSMIYARKIEKPFVIRFPSKRHQSDKSTHILYQSLKASIDHHFERAERLVNRLCQVCHEFLLVPDAVKCLTCGLVCHHSCIMQQVIKFK